jgi:serine protease AprX
MAAAEKYEPRLTAVLEHRRARAAAAGARAAGGEEEPINVIISHAEAVRADEQRERGTEILDLGERVRVRQRTILETVKKVKAPDPTVHSIVNAVSASLTPKQLAEVAKLDEVELVRLDAPEHVTCMNESTHVIEAIEAQQDLGANGRGIKVAILDTGIDKNHPALLGKIVDEISVAAEPITVPGLHATHVAGTVASNDVVFRGIAPQADLINIKVLTAAGFGTPTSVIQGLEQAVRRGALVASLSLGWSEIFHAWVCNDADCVLCQAADNAVRLGVTVVVAAGNEGNAGARPPFAVRHPGAARKVITVGAVDKAKVLTSFSSIGPASGRLSPASAIRLTKPDVSAPGLNIVSSVLGGGFAALSGTSMATPHVSGVVALVLQKNANLTPTMVKKILEETSEPLENTPNQIGYGLVNAYAAAMRAAMGVPRALAVGAA